MMLFIICTKERLGIETQGIRRSYTFSSIEFKIRLRFFNIYLIYIYLYIVSVQSRFVK